MATPSLSFPNETDGYRASRRKLLDAEIELRDKIEAVAALRREMPLGGRTDDYVFDGVQGPVKLSELFRDGKDSLIVYSFMYGPDMAQPCPMCACYADGADGYAPHLCKRINFALVAQSPIERFAAMGENRGWRNHQLLSAANNSYSTDYMGQTPDGNQLPMVNVFVKRDDGIFHFWNSELFFEPSAWHPRHVDQLWPLWHHFDLTPEGRGDHMP